LAIGAKGYFECSAITGEGINELFEKAIHFILGGLEDRGNYQRDALGSEEDKEMAQRNKRRVSSLLCLPYLISVDGDGPPNDFSGDTQKGK
jgi:hypothetical protein